MTSYLMMGALSPGLKRHSVTLFEGEPLGCAAAAVGKAPIPGAFAAMLNGCRLVCAGVPICAVLGGSFTGKDRIPICYDGIIRALLMLAAVKYHTASLVALQHAWQPHQHMLPVTVQPCHCEEPKP